MKHSRTILLTLMVLGLLAIILMYIDYFISNPPIPLEERAYAYEGNILGSFWSHSLFVMAEIAAMYFLVFFRANQRFFVRLLFFLFAAIAWMIYSMFQTMHGGGVKVIFLFWQVLFNLVLLFYIIFLLINNNR